MGRLRLFMDEDVYGAVAPALRSRQFDAISTFEVDRHGETDESQLLWATAHDRAVVTFNVADFAALHADWLRHSRHHAGIIVSAQRPIGDVVGRLAHLAGSLDSASMIDRIEFLSDW